MTTIAPSPPPTETLDQALSRVWEHDWQHRRSGPTLRSQAEIAVKAVRKASPLSSVFPIVGQRREDLRASDVSAVDIREVILDWYAHGISPATIQKRLNCLSKLGVNVEGCRVKVPKQLKWHLKTADEGRVLEFCHSVAGEDGRKFVTMARFVRWSTRTGLRIEESLRLRRCDFSEDFLEFTVPGTKTEASQATLPLGYQMRAEMEHWDMTGYDGPRSSRLLFPMTYLELQNMWDLIRHQFGWQDDPTATLKALRRSAARYLHIDCNMPLHMVQQYLRHESMDTTLEYLRLTGGYGTEEMRRYLK